jgi:predicted transcriptional regulator
VATKSKESDFNFCDLNPLFLRALKKGYDKKLSAVEKAKEETLKRFKREFDERLRQKDVEVVRREKEIEVKVR